MILKDKRILITGGTGTFGRKCAEVLLREYEAGTVVVFSRDERKQRKMADDFNTYAKRMRFFLGDVRDKKRLYRALNGVDLVIHAAALKQVPTAEYNPIEAIKTNINGASNIIDAAIDMKVSRVIALSTDKAVNPLNLYGATKFCSDKLFVAANTYAGDEKTTFSVVRYGNVLGSRGSVVPLFRKLKTTGRLPVTDERMTRFWITLEQGARFVLERLSDMQGGEIFIPKIPSTRIIDLARAICPECEVDIVGIRPGEKLHELMIPEDEARNSYEFTDYYVIVPAFVGGDKHYSVHAGKQVPENFSYGSDTNPWFLGVDEISNLLKDV